MKYQTVRLLVVATVGLVVALAGCELLEPARPAGTLVVAFSPDGLVARTIQPELSMDPASYDVRGEGPADSSFEHFDVTDTTIVETSLVPGEWTVTVEAKNAAGTVIGYGQVVIDVLAGQVATTTVPVTPVVGTGVLEIEVSWPAGVLTTPEVRASLAPTGGGALIPLTFVPAPDGLSASATEPALPNGYYLMNIYLSDEGFDVWSTVESVRIVAGETSRGVYALEEDVNRGGLTVEIDVDMQNPWEVTFDASDPIELDPPVDVTITGTVSPAQPGLDYSWYLNGSDLGVASPSISIGADLPGGVHWLSLVVTDGTVISSATIRVIVGAEYAPPTPSAAFVYVSPSGSDSEAGTYDAPVRTIAQALTLAVDDVERDAVRVASGVYPGTVDLANGISIYGGFSADGTWASGIGTTEIVGDVAPGGAVFGVRAADIEEPTELADLTIRTPNATVSGSHNYAIHVQRSPDLTLTRVVVDAGNGARGTNGANGAAGSNGPGGARGGNGSADGNSWGAGGSGGWSIGLNAGGNGGRGGSEGANTGYNGARGGGPFAGSGGNGGGGGDPGRDGGNGAGGAGGASGSHGSGGGAGIASGVYWLGRNGTNGGNGANGSGGGGGGGGGGQGCFFCDDGAGNGGGGGGAGGGGGSAGTRGTAGGSSFGLFIVASTGITIGDSEISAGDGGDGGSGGVGGSGGSGGSGGFGGSAASTEIGEGGDGGRGGNGGRGGDGGGGAGGDSIALALMATTASTSGLTLLPGAAGSGGYVLAPSARGRNGRSLPTYTQ